MPIPAGRRPALPPNWGWLSGHMPDNHPQFDEVSARRRPVGVELPEELGAALGLVALADGLGRRPQAVERAQEAAVLRRGATGRSPSPASRLPAGGRGRGGSRRGGRSSTRRRRARAGPAGPRRRGSGASGPPRRPRPRAARRRGGPGRRRGRPGPPRARRRGRSRAGRWRSGGQESHSSAPILVGRDSTASSSAPSPDGGSPATPLGSAGPTGSAGRAGRPAR